MYESGQTMALQITGAQGRAKRAGIQPGWRLLSINGEPVLDFIDYNWFSAQTDLDILVDTGKGEKSIRVYKPAEEPLGLDLEGLYPQERQCANRCVFCFVDQMAPGMRDSLYVKDDDWRYSVLFGNYITLTNVGEREFQRILRRAPSPLYISVHATDPDVRVRMMGNESAGRILEQLRALGEAGIQMHCQIVLVPGYNDGDVLLRSLRDLWALHPAVRTVAVVPVGLTRFREGLPELLPVDRAAALAAVETVENFAQGCLQAKGVQFAFAADELVERAGLPPRRYGGEHTPQVANGVGLVSNLLDELEWALQDLPEELPVLRRVSIITGTSAYGLMENVAAQLSARVRNLEIQVIRAQNRLFGSSVTVVGLLSGADIAEAAAGHNLGDEVLISQAALRSGEDVFLDGMTLSELARRVGVPVRAVGCDGEALARAICSLQDHSV